MGTKKFNLLDKFIAWMRLGTVLPYVEVGDVLLDFGCGHQAYLLNQVKDKIKRGVGLDYDTETGDIDVHIKKHHFYFKKSLPFKDKEFNKIVMLAVIEHIELESINALFKEFVRVLAPNGRIIITTPTPGLGKFILEFLAFKLGIISKDEVGDHKKYYSKSDLNEIAQQYDLTFERYSTFQFGGNSICVLKK